MFLAIRWWTEDSYFDWVHQLAQKHGRWHYYYSYLFAVVPFLSKSFVYYKIVTLGLLALTIVAFYYVIRRTFGINFAVLTVLTYLLSIQVGGNHSLLTGYFYTFHLTMIFLAFSFYFFWRYLETTQPRPLYVSVGLYLLAVPFHETIVLYVGVYLLLIVLKSRTGSLTSLRPWLPTIPFIFIAVAFTVSTLIFRQLHPSEYAANVMDTQSFTFSGMIQTYLRFTLSAMPGYYFFDPGFTRIFEQYAPMFPGPEQRLGYVFTNLRLAWVVRALLVVVVLALVFRDASVGPRPRVALGATCIGLLVASIPNALLSLSPDYQEFGVALTRISSHMTYLVHFGVALMFAGVLWACFAYLSRDRTRVVRSALIVAVVSISVFICIVTDFSNYYGSHMLNMVRQKWVAVDKLSKTDVFMELPQDSVIIAPDLWSGVMNPYYQIRNYSGGHLVRESTPTYWSKYLWAHTGKWVHIFRSSNEVEEYRNQDRKARSGVYYLRYLQDSRTTQQVLVIGKVSNPAETRVDSVHVLTIGCQQPPALSVEVNGSTRRLDVPAAYLGSMYQIDLPGMDLATLIGAFQLPAHIARVEIDPNLPAKLGISRAFVDDGTLHVVGWAIGPQPITRVEVRTEDGSVSGTATYGLPRPDVLRDYPEYRNGQSGYAVELPLTASPPETIVVEIYSGDERIASGRLAVDR